MKQFASYNGFLVPNATVTLVSLPGKRECTN
jgi:hypothetical protein